MQLLGINAHAKTIIGSDGHGQGMAACSPSATTSGDESFQDSPHVTCFISPAHAHAVVSCRNSDDQNISTFHTVQELYIGLSQTPSSLTLRATATEGSTHEMEQGERTAIKKKLNLSLRLGPLRTDEEDGFSFDQSKQRSAIDTATVCEYTPGSEQADEELRGGALNLNIGLSTNSSREPSRAEDDVERDKIFPRPLMEYHREPLVQEGVVIGAGRWQEDIQITKIAAADSVQSPCFLQFEHTLCFDKTLPASKSIMPATPKAAVTGAKRVFSEALSDDPSAPNGAAKFISSSAKTTACESEARVKHYSSACLVGWNVAPTVEPPAVYWQIGMPKSSVMDTLTSSKQVHIKGEVTNASQELGHKTACRRPSLLPTGGPSDAGTHAKTKSKNVDADTTPRAPVGWPPVQSFRKNSLPALKPKMHSDKESDRLVTTSFQSPKGHSQSDCLFVKVYMDGLSIGRKIDLKNYNGYEKLSLALEEMFRHFGGGQTGNKALASEDNEISLKGNYVNFFSESEYVLTYEDKDGDLMLVGDVPWGMFIGTVKRLRIMKGSEAIGLVPKSSAKVK